MNSQAPSSSMFPLNPLSASDPINAYYDDRSSWCFNEESNFTNATLKFINDMLMEEDDLENTPFMLHDSLALLATQKSLEAVLNNDARKDDDDNNHLNEERCSEILYDSVLLSSGPNQFMMQANDGKPKGGHQPNKNNTDEFIDLRSMLTTCAQAVSSYDVKSANHLLMQIRMYSSPQGDSTERVVHCLANALEARLNGAGTPIYAALNSTKRSAAEVLRAYKMCITFLPIKKVSMMLSNKAIEKLAAGATTLHIIDFGIMYGFQWPRLIQILSARLGGPPKLRITGIEYPLAGDSPAESLEETGRRLAKYCERFRVPFEYNAIARNWESVRVEDLEIRKDEVVVVNCMFRSHHLLDETLAGDNNNPRDAVLKLIRESNPAMFIHGVLNGQFHVPFFTTRFSEAMHHMSNLFDMLEAMIPPEDEDRGNFEQLLLGKVAMNIIACEGTERIERPETYKNWRARMRKAGFRQLPLDQDTVRHLKSTVKAEYHKDFFVDEDGKWMLLGWKGRVNEAVSCWKPV